MGFQVDVAHFVAEAEKHEDEDQRFREACKKRRYFETYIYNEKKKMNSKVLIILRRLII